MFKKKKKEIENPLYNQFHRLVDKYETVVVFFHVVPDFDALGSAFGVYTWLKANYKRKKIYILGENHQHFSGPGCLYPMTDRVEDIDLVDNPFLAIVVDTADRKRISDDRYKMAREVIKIDHHSTSEPYGDLEIVETDVSSAAEIVTGILTANPDLTLPSTSAKFLFSGIVGDSGRFLHQGTSGRTFQMAARLLETGFDQRSDVYEPMYTKPKQALRVQAYILNNYVLSPRGVAYYILEEETLEALDLLPTAGKEHINMFALVEGINIWVSFAADSEEVRTEKGTSIVPFYRVSIRTAKYPLTEVAKKYRGGGHQFACGARVYSKKELQALISDLDNLIK